MSDLQRRLVSKIQAAANIITLKSRAGPANNILLGKYVHDMIFGFIQKKRKKSIEIIKESIKNEI